MSAFAAAVDALFADPNLAREATYEPADGDPFPVRVIARRADADHRLRRRAALVGDDALRRAGRARSRPRVRATGSSLDGETFVVQGEPVRDRERLVWTLDARPA